MLPFTSSDSPHHTKRCCNPMDCATAAKYNFATIRFSMYVELLCCATPFRVRGTVLHAGRIFAVAPLKFPSELILADPLVSRLGRLCSHPYRYRRRALPATVLHISCEIWACPDVPPQDCSKGDCLMQISIIPRYNQNVHIVLRCRNG